MKRKIFTALFIIIPAVVFSATETEIIQQAKAKFAGGAPEEAVSMLEGFIIATPASPQAKRVLADICVDTGEREYAAKNYKNAYEYFKKAVKYMPTHPIASERYWTMKNQFDVNNLKNEGTAITAVKGSDTGKQTGAQTGNKIEPAVKQPVEPKAVDAEYVKRILNMEERFNKRILQMAEVTAASKKEQDTFLSEFRSPKMITIGILLVLLSGTAIWFMTVYVKNSISGLIKKRKGKKEFDEITDDAKAAGTYNELIKMQNIKELLSKIKAGDLDWTGIKKSIGDMDRELRIEILNYVEGKLERERQPLSLGQADLLLCLYLDGDDYLRRRVNLFMSNVLEHGQNMTSGVQALTYAGQQQGNAGKPGGLLQIGYSKSLVEESMLSDLNVAIPLSKLVDRKVFKDRHAARVGCDCYYMAGLLDLDPAECNLYYISGLLHDIGYLDVPSELLNKKGALTEEEQEKIRTHPKKGVELLDFTDIPDVVKDGILYHHENWDGSGYPDGLSKDKIPLVAQVAHLFDVFEALLLTRPYRPALPAREAFKIIKKGVGKLFNPKLYEYFEKMATENLLSKEEIWK